MKKSKQSSAPCTRAPQARAEVTDVGTQLYVLGSGSKGNAFALTHNGSTLLIEAGFSARELSRRLQAAGIDESSLVGIAITHEHGDHARGATRLGRLRSIPVIASMGTWKAVSRGGEPCEWLSTGSRGPAVAGPFTVESCPSPHDAAEPVVLGVRVDGGPSLAIATDLGQPTQGIRWFLRERNCLIMESNYDEVMLRTSRYPAVVQQRIAGNGGHLSNTSCARLLEELCHSGLGVVVLAHLSQQCNSPDAALTAVKASLGGAGFGGTILVASQHGPMPPIRIKSPGQEAFL